MINHQSEFFFFYLSIKRVALQLILTLELPGVSLVHGQSVLRPFKYLSFINLVNLTFGEAFLVSGHCHHGHPLTVSIFTKPCSLLLIGVVVENQGKPKFSNIIIC